MAAPAARTTSGACISTHSPRISLAKGASREGYCRRPTPRLSRHRLAWRCPLTRSPGYGSRGSQRRAVGSACHPALSRSPGAPHAELPRVHGRDPTSPDLDVARCKAWAGTATTCSRARQTKRAATAHGGASSHATKVPMPSPVGRNPLIELPLESSSQVPSRSREHCASLSAAGWHSREPAHGRSYVPSSR